MCQNEPSCEPFIWRCFSPACSFSCKRNFFHMKGLTGRLTLRKWLRAWTNEKCLATKHHQTLFGEQTFYRLDTLFGAVWSCLIVLNRVWSCLGKFEGHQTFDQNLILSLLFSYLMGDVLFGWTAGYQTCLMRPCISFLLSGLYQLFHLCVRLIKDVLTVWPLTSTLACLVTKQWLMVFGRHTFLLCPGPSENSEMSRYNLPCFYITALRDWFKKFAPLRHLIGSRTKTNRDSLELVSPRVAQGYMYFA